MKKAILLFSLMTGFSAPASAETTLLSCRGSSGPPFVIKLDTENKTIINGWDGANNSYPIQITDDVIG